MLNEGLRSVANSILLARKERSDFLSQLRKETNNYLARTAIDRQRIQRQIEQECTRTRERLAQFQHQNKRSTRQRLDSLRSLRQVIASAETRRRQAEVGSIRRAVQRSLRINHFERIRSHRISQFHIRSSLQKIRKQVNQIQYASHRLVDQYKSHRLASLNGWNQSIPGPAAIY